MGEGTPKLSLLLAVIADIIQNEKSMSKIEQIEGAVQELSAEELAAFRAWFLQVRRRRMGSAIRI
jgi:hypothetical protein